MNNTLLAFGAEGLATSLALAHRLGLDTSLVRGAFEGGPLLSPWEVGKLRRIEDGDYSPEFPLKLALEGRSSGAGTGRPRAFLGVGVARPGVGAVVEQGGGDEDVTVVTRFLEG